MKFSFVLHFCFMALPFFYSEEIAENTAMLLLNEETSKHVVQVLRMKLGDELQLTDGKGNLFLTALTDDHKKKAVVKIISWSFTPILEKKVSIAISLVKNASRFEWFLEKATEIGVREIIPMLCERTEKQHFRFDRMKGIMISAMLQSQQCWLPVLHEPVKYEKLAASNFDDYRKLIAHCLPEGNKEKVNQQDAGVSNQLVLIGPEGDFTTGEIQQALEHGFIPVTLGATRLRTETAGIVAATLLCND